MSFSSRLSMQSCEPLIPFAVRTAFLAAPNRNTLQCQKLYRQFSTRTRLETRQRSSRPHGKIGVSPGSTRKGAPQSERLNKPPSPSQTLQKVELEDSSRRERINTRRRNFVFYAGSLIGFATAVFLSYELIANGAAVRRSNTLLKDGRVALGADVTDRYDRLGARYDREVESAERYMFLGSKRKKMCQQVSGKVLEVSAGTGRNLEYYDLRPQVGSKGSSIDRLTFNDNSKVMVDVAQKNFAEQQAKLAPLKRIEPGKVKWVIGDAGKEDVIQRPEGGFDYIVQVMGLCSITDPVPFLKRLGELVRQPNKQSKLEQKKKDMQLAAYGEIEEAEHDAGGKILLLEHGRSHYQWLDKFLDNRAPDHADKFGCWWNKDIAAIVDESGLKVESIQRYQFGTVWQIVLRPKDLSDSE